MHRQPVQHIPFPLRQSAFSSTCRSP
jgi:hypothetical protein